MSKKIHKNEDPAQEFEKGRNERDEEREKRIKAEKESNFFRHIVENSPEALIIQNPEGKILYINSQARKLTGFEDSYFLDKNFPEEIIHSEDIEKFRSITQSLKNGNEVYEIEYRLVHSSGNYKWVRHFIRTLKQGETVTGFQNHITDIQKEITEKESLKKIEKELSNYQILMQAAITQSPVPMVVVDYPDLTFKVINKACEDFLLISAENYLQKKMNECEWAWKEFYPDGNPVKDPSKLPLPMALKGITTRDMEMHIVRKDGSIVVELASAAPIYGKDGEMIAAILAMVDITERKKTEQTIKDSHELLSLFIKYSPIYTFIKEVSSAESKVLYASENYEEMIGIKGSDMVGKNMQELFPKEFADKITADDWSVVSNGEFLKLDEELNNRFYITYKYPIVQKNKRLLAGYTVDITDRKISEKILLENEFKLKEQNEEYEAINEELQKTNEELLIAKQRSEESDLLKTAFLQNMSHEIRTPMNAICGFTEFLKDKDLSEEKRNNYISIIEKSSYQLLSIVTNILTISSLETKQEKIIVSPVELNSVIVDLLTVFKQQSINPEVSLHTKTDLNDNEAVINTDRTKLIQVLSNLLSNALKFTHQGYIEFGYTVKDRFLEFFVKDTGIGIKKEQLENIFERFRQGDISITKKYGGTGLGLSISKGFIEMLGGKIWVESEPGKGSVFYFTLPFVPVISDENSTPSMDKRNRKTVLVAEDEEFNFLFIKELLLKLDIQVIHAKDGLECIDLVTKNPNIDLILMDIKMPGIDGYTASCKIKMIKPSIPVIAQSAYALEHEIEKYSDVFDGYITKPINGNELNTMIRKFVLL